MQFPVVSDGSCWFPLVILYYPWLSLVIRGYPWLYLVIYDSNICEIFAHLQLSFPSFAEIFCSRGTTGKAKRKGSQRQSKYIRPQQKNLYALNALFYTLAEMIFRGTIAKFCKSKKCIIFNVHYRPRSKKSKFDMT